MGEAKRRKNLGIPPRKKTEDIKLPQLDKKAIQQKVRSTSVSYTHLTLPTIYSV